MPTLNGGAKKRSYTLSFHSLRNISCPEDTEAGRKVYTGHLPLKSILDLPTDENVRGYLVQAEGKVRQTPTSVHRAIKETLLNNPEDFCVLNSGIVIVARKLEADDKEKVMTLSKPSIINGAQTQGVIKDLAAENALPDPEIHIKFEVIVTEDDNVIADISIARNYQNDVMTISMAGKKGQLDDLYNRMKEAYPDQRLRRSESQWASEDFIDTEKLLQVMTALVPDELWVKNPEGDTPNKVYTYNAKTKCLKDYQMVYEKAHNEQDPDHKKYSDLYKFFLDIAPSAWDLYLNWKSHQGFSGTRLREIERDGKKIVDVPDGILFPIIAAFAVFAKKTKGVWRLDTPALFKDEEMIKAAKTVYMDIAGSDPQKMGKSKACYSALVQITNIYKKFDNLRS
jgi:hypothetical protein